MNAKHEHIPKAVEEILSNPLFLMSHYNPTAEPVPAWEKWLASHPQDEQVIQSARMILDATMLNKRTLSKDDSALLFNRIQNSIHLLRKKKRHKKRMYKIAAACIVLICFSSYLLFTHTHTSPDIIYAEKVLPQIDCSQKEVELDLSNHGKVLVANKSKIEFDGTNVVQVNQDNIRTVVEKPEKEVMKGRDETREMNLLKVPQGRHVSVKLPDGTVVWVNSGTILQFPAYFDEAHRTIYVDGEIYLEVFPDPSRPFHVRTSQMDIRVLGTRFNVTAYSDDISQSVVLAEGGVEVQTKNGEKQRIQPNDCLLWKDEQISVSQVNIYDYISWKDGVFYFNNKKLTYIVQRISRYYRKQIVCDENVANQTCTGKLVLFDDFNKVLHTLEESLCISHEIDGNTIKLSTNLKK